MEFKEFSNKIQAQFDKMCETGMLFRTAITGQKVWDLYLDSFEDNPTFRDPESSQHNCNLCNNFIRRYGNIVAIINGEVKSLFCDLELEAPYDVVATSLSKAITKEKIENVFFETYDSLNKLPYESCSKTQDLFKVGFKSNHKRYTKEEAEQFGVVKPNEIRTFHHFNLDIPSQFVNKSGKSIEQITSFYRDKYSVFKRCMEEIPVDTLILVRDLINQGSLLDGTAHLHAVENIIKSKESIPKWFDDKWYWQQTYNMEERVAKFKNTLIGVLCSELAEGMELNKACLNWNKRVDPANYHKATAPITKKQIEDAQKFVSENDYEESFNRRLATIDDIKADEIRYLNSGDGTVKTASIFDNVKATSTRHKKSEYENVEEVSIDKFMKDVLPGCSNLEVLLKNNHEGNLVSLTTSNIEASKPIFKWDNNYSWTFNGNLAGKSQIKQAVKTAGGDVSGVLRFSIMWAENDGDNSDLDAHAKCGSEHIFYSKKKGTITGGLLDIDVTNPGSQMPNGAVENITYPDIDKLNGKTIEFAIHQYAARRSKGFKAEIEFDGKIFNYEYNKPLSRYIKIASVSIKNGEFSIEHSIPSSENNQSKNIWGLDTNEFHKVNLVCNSPNHWGDNEVGNKHYMFMIEGCVNSNQTRGFHNENLIPNLLKHRKVMEVLGSTSMIESNENQLSGIGFNSTVKDELIVKVSGSHKRMLKIKF